MEGVVHRFLTFIDKYVFIPVESERLENTVLPSRVEINGGSGKVLWEIAKDERFLIDAVVRELDERKSQIPRNVVMRTYSEERGEVFLLLVTLEHERPQAIAYAASQVLSWAGVVCGRMRRQQREPATLVGSQRP